LKIMNIMYRLSNVVLLFLTLESCATTSTTSVPTKVTYQTPQPISTVDNLENPPTFTARSSFALSPSTTPDQTQIASENSMFATQAAVNTRIAQFPRICTHDYYSPSPGRFSPNGLWLEELCYSDDDQSLILTLANRDEQTLWKFLYRDYIPQMDFVPDGGMAVVHWLNDGKYAYFTSFFGGDGGECFYDGGDRGSGVFRVNLQTGQSTTILPLNNNFWWYGFSFSPTDRRLVYGARARDLKLLDLKTGEVININPASNFSEGGGFLWSSDGLMLVYSTVKYLPNHVGREGYTLRLVDAQTGSERILLDSPVDCFNAKSWTEDNILILEKNYSEELIEFDLHSNKIISESPATP